MGQFAGGLRAGLGEAARKMADPLRDGDAGAAGAWRERPGLLRGSR